MGAHPEESGVVIATEHSEHEPDEAIGPDGPRTPVWLPLVGGIAFVVGVVSFIATRPPGKTAAELQEQARTAAAELRAKQAPPEPVAAPQAAQPMPDMPMPVRPPGKGG
jgi:hypothetical protein